MSRGGAPWTGIAVVALSYALGAPVPAQQPGITSAARELNRRFEADVDEWARRFEHEGRAIYDKRYAILDELALEPGLAVADIGAGSGLITRLIAECVGSRGTVYAVDIAKAMVDHIERTAMAQGRVNLHPILGDPRSPKLPPSSVDRVCIIDTYHHFEYPADMLAEIRTALRPNGLQVLIDFTRITGVSRPHILGMVRAGQGTFTDEFLDAGFELIERREDLLPEQYLLKFRRTK